MIQVRRATEHDLHVIHNLDRDHSPVFQDRASYAGLLSGDAGLVMVATQDDNTCGLAAWSVVDDVAELLNLAVSPRLRRHGAARRLMEDSCEELSQRQVMRLLLDVRASNDPARRLYESLGFSMDGLRRSYYPPQGDGGREDAILMSCDLETVRASS